MDEHASKKMLLQYGIHITKELVASDKHEAVAFAGKIGYPVAMKVLSCDIVHKTDVGGVLLGIANPEEAADAYDKIIKTVSEHKPHAKIKGVIIEEMINGHELIVGSKKDIQFGPIIMLGLGGIFVEVLEDVSFRVIPITEKDAGEMIHELKSFKVLMGARGEHKANLSKIKAALVSVSKLVMDHPEIEELDINPLIVDERRAIAADARIIVS